MLHVRHLIVIVWSLSQCSERVFVPICLVGVHKIGRAFSLFYRPLLWNPVYRTPQDLSANGGVCETKFVQAIAVGLDPAFGKFEVIAISTTQAFRPDC